MKKLFSSLVFLGLLTFSGNALAAPVTFQMGNSSWIDTSNTADGLLMWSDIYSSVETEQFTLSAGQFHTFKFARLGTTESWVNGDDLVPKTITAWLDFATPYSGVQNVTGETVGHSRLFGIFQGWDVSWNDPVSVTLANGISFDISFFDARVRTFPLTGPDGLFGTAFADVTATVLLNSEAVPLPGAFLLLGSGLAALAGTRLRRKKELFSQD